MSEKSKAALLKDKLFANAKNGCLVSSESEMEKAYQFAQGYKTFLDAGKTERRFLEAAIRAAKDAGFSEYDSSKKYKSGDKI